MTYQDAARVQAARWLAYATGVRLMNLLPAVAETAGRNAAAQSTAPELKRRVIAELGGLAGTRDDRNGRARVKTAARHNATCKARARSLGF